MMSYGYCSISTSSRSRPQFHNLSSVSQDSSWNQMPGSLNCVQSCEIIVRIPRFVVKESHMSRQKLTSSETSSIIRMVIQIMVLVPTRAKTAKGITSPFFGPVTHLPPHNIRLYFLTPVEQDLPYSHPSFFYFFLSKRCCRFYRISLQVFTCSYIILKSSTFISFLFFLRS